MQYDTIIFFMEVIDAEAKHLMTYLKTKQSIPLLAKNLQFSPLNVITTEINSGFKDHRNFFLMEGPVGILLILNTPKAK